MKEAIIDNTALNYLARLEELSYERIGRSSEIIRRICFLFQKIHVPVSVKNEFASTQELTPYKDQLRDMIEREQLKFRNCSRFDSIVLAQLTNSRLSGIDKGDAEAISQAYQIDVRFFITDDGACVEAIGKRYPEMHCLDTLVLLAALDLHQYLLDREELLRLFFTEVRPAQRKKVPALLRAAYIKAGELYGVRLEKKELAIKTSAKVIFDLS